MASNRKILVVLSLAAATVFSTEGYAREKHETGPCLAIVATENCTKESIGDKMPDGTIYAGISPDTHKPMYATPADASLTYTFNEAKKYAADLDANGHHDWRVPTQAELNVLFNNRAAIGGFNLTSSVPADLYWSTSQLVKWGAWAQRFSDGSYYNHHTDDRSALRCVRSLPPET